MPRRTRRPAANDDPRRPERASQPGGGAPGGTGSASGIPAAGWYRLSQWRTRGFWTSQRVCQLVVCGLLLLAVALAFAQTAGFSFVNLDDTDYVTGNPHVSAGLSWEGTVWALTKTQMSNWHPLTWLSLMLDCSLYDLHPGGHHVTNVLLHAATVVGLFLVLQAMTGGTGSASGTLWPSALVAALFAIHPLRAESVAWVTERKDVLSGLFFVLTLGAYVAYARRPFSLARYAAVMVCLALGLLSKAILVPVPFLLLLLDYWPLGRLAIKPRSSIAPCRCAIVDRALRCAIVDRALRCAIVDRALRCAIVDRALRWAIVDRALRCRHVFCRDERAIDDRGFLAPVGRKAPAPGGRGRGGRCDHLGPAVGDRCGRSKVRPGLAAEIRSRSAT